MQRIIIVFFLYYRDEENAKIALGKMQELSKSVLEQARQIIHDYDTEQPRYVIGFGAFF